MIKTATFISLALTFLSASLLGIFGQDIAYYLVETYSVLKLHTVLKWTTGLSYVLYIFYLAFATIQYKREVIGRRVILTCIYLFVTIGGLVFVWSFFVLAMWLS